MTTSQADRQIKFRGRRLDTGEWVYGYYCLNPFFDRAEIYTFDSLRSYVFIVDKNTVGRFTGLFDKNGKEIYEGDHIRWCVPHRTTQTHTGDNIPNGSYTEPMEPGIKWHESTVIFKDGMFCIDHDDDGEYIPLSWVIVQWTLVAVESHISYSKQNADIFDDPEEGDLQYLINEVAKVKNAQELIEYLSGVEIVGNEFQEL